ncbi:MAG: DUF1587 domain-containing protein, partial [Aureliella sp.]
MSGSTFIPQSIHDRFHWQVLWCTSLLFLYASSSALAQPGRDKEELSWDRNVEQIFRRHCYRCHNDDDPSGNVNLAQDEDPGQILQHKGIWTTAFDMLQSGQMPPEDERQPSEDQRRIMLSFLKETFASSDCQQGRDPGRPILRRLNNVEYDNAIIDLTGLNLQLAKNFPPDPTGYGFDNNGEALA